MPAKIIHHQNKYHRYLNDDLKSVTEKTHFKIVFSHSDELSYLEKGCKHNKGEYLYDKENTCQIGKFSRTKIIKEELFWGNIMTFNLLHIADYIYHSSIHSFKGEVYIKDLSIKF